jgi:hypothetical protein
MAGDGRNCQATALKSPLLHIMYIFLRYLYLRPSILLENAFSPNLIQETSVFSYPIILREDQSTRHIRLTQNIYIIYTENDFREFPNITEKISHLYSGS